MKTYDIVIIGGGTAGIFAAYELNKLNPDSKIALTGQNGTGKSLFIKHLICEPRPFVTLDNVRLLITETDPLSFPSGHTTSTLSFVTFFVLNMKELAEKHYKIIDAALILFAVLIPFSRMYVGVHYPGDVLAGAVIGILGAWIVNRYKTKIRV